MRHMTSVYAPSPICNEPIARRSHLVVDFRGLPRAGRARRPANVPSGNARGPGRQMAGPRLRGRRVALSRRVAAHHLSSRETLPDPSDQVGAHAIGALGLCLGWASLGVLLGHLWRDTRRVTISVGSSPPSPGRCSCTSPSLAACTRFRTSSKRRSEKRTRPAWPHSSPRRGWARYGCSSTHRSLDGGKTWEKNHQRLEARRIGPARSLGPLAPAKKPTSAEQRGQAREQ
jgi:hypothetical protein